jgi:DNA modification methylase
MISIQTRAGDVAGKVNSIHDVLRGVQARGAQKAPAKPQLKSLKGRQKADFKLLDPSTLAKAKYGYRDDVPWIISNDDALAGVSRLPDNFVDCVVTSPPYYWQRDYGVEGQTGQEDTVEAYVEALAGVFREVLRVLKPTGTAFVVLGDTYYSGKGQPKGGDPKQVWRGVARQKYRAVDRPGFGLPKKSLLGIPWRVALALQADGWVLRSCVIWRKTKPLAEPSVRDRPWTTTETIFILTKTGKYFFNRDGLDGQEDIWDIPAHNASKRYRHAAPYPEALVERCLAVGCPKKGVVLDPYAGSGTTLAVAANRRLPSIGVELSPHYVTLARQRLITKPDGR